MSAVAYAQEYISHGVPVVVCQPCPGFENPGGCDRHADGSTELHTPAGWNKVRAEDCDLGTFVEGESVLALVGGHGVDIVDVDTKVGGSIDNMPSFRRFGEHRTPSGGGHYLVRSTGIAKISPLDTSSGHVGDYVGGTQAEGGRLLAYLPGSSRPKYRGRGYDIVAAMDWDAWAEFEPDDGLISALLGAGGTFDATAGRPAARSAELEAFRERHAGVAGCKYGQGAVASLLKDSGKVVDGDPLKGRHGWAIRAACRAVELVQVGCCTIAQLDTLAERFREMKPEEDFNGALRWALANADPAKCAACQQHREAFDVSLADAETRARRLANGADLDGAEVLTEVDRYLARFVSYPTPSARIAHVLWIAHTWLMDEWDVTPRLAFLSPEPGSGKTRALEVTKPLVPRAIHAVNVSPAYLFRKVSDRAGSPTILFDEIDTVFGPKAHGNEDIRGMLNAGFKRGAFAGRAVASKNGGQVGLEELPAYAAVALAGLDDLPDTIMTRAVVVRMRHRRQDETVESWRQRNEVSVAGPVAERLASWATAHADRVDLTSVEMPVGVEDRDADMWEPLIMVADLAGGTWPAAARTAAIEMVTSSKNRRPSRGIQLLRDLRSVFVDDVFLPSKEVLARLHNLPDSQWMDVGYGRALTAQGLAKDLERYQVRPSQGRVLGTPTRGYRRQDLLDVWARYLPPMT